ncbi:hypothetical protein SY88_11880 [Clostridiales bacterium PH28_bin88]|nr:hypothetical protein SY88_11880 [Clostridiales bacterium PH28_bin88]
MQVLRVNTEKGNITSHPLDAEWEHLGGRGLASRLVAREVPPTAHPLGRHNKVVIAPGLLTGSAVPCSGRLSVGGKSPLTGTIKESNVGGTAGQRLARLGYRAVVFAGSPEPGHWHLLYISPEGARLEPAGDLVGLGNYDLVAALREWYGRQVSVISIGPAGERMLPLASVAVTNTEGQPSRHAGRGGMGAVLGSKGIKAVVLDKPSPGQVAPRDPERFREALRGFVSALRTNPTTAKVLPTYGTTALVDIVNEAGALPTRNYSTGRFEGASRINGDTFLRLVRERGGVAGHPCHPGCIIRCSNVYNDAAGRYLTSGLEYETIGMLGSNCGVDDLDAIAAMDRLCDDLGLDTMEVGAALAVAMEAGVLPFGDSRGMRELIEEMVQGTYLGKILGQGAAITGRVLGVRRVPVVKGQSMAAYDPRALKGAGVTYATSPMGADHTNGNGLGGKVDPLGAGGQREYARFFGLAHALFDTLGLCWFTRAPFLEDRRLIAELLSGFTGREWTTGDLEAVSARVIEVERGFNRRAGFDRAHDRLPEFFGEERLHPHETVFDVPEEELDAVYGGA